ncbi:SnoaL-like domain-containing protein [Marilutibacter chinensis]|uniref:Nuclear transport factor 2 family protein n=1 Tax=Marilutibacter chinensis TaxID=2912247 RepID=A0ABS9HT65_9GAMM|nr:SnoaL-like domain-containing protein [Lysobacter chinensis]MCF7221550.1 nuclear transport factor 2 family protein [Lysobacter chinensis]
MSKPETNTQSIAERLVALCREGKYEQAQEELYADDAVSVEMAGASGFPERVEGMEAIREKGRQWADNIVEIHGGSVSDPVVADGWFSVAMGIDATYKDMGRVDMKEICVYRVRDGRIVHEQFFYEVG